MLDLIDEVAALRRQLAEKDALLGQQSKQIDIMSSKQKEYELHATKLKAAVSHRDTVIAELATSRKLVFEECHRACMANQGELRQMQDALHRVSRQLQRERREHASRIKELRRNTSASSTSSTSSLLSSKETTGTRGPLSPFLREENDSGTMPWDDLDLDDATGLCFDEGIDIMDGPHSPPNVDGPSSSSLKKSAARHADNEDEETYDDPVGSPPCTDAAATIHPEDVDFLTW
jgi:hypothetical protein